MKIWLLALALAGCGGGNHHAGDDVDAATDGTGSADAAIDGPTMGRVDVVVLGDYLGDKLDGLPVVFNAKDGSVLGVEMTDASGRASHVIPRDAMVTVIHPTGNTGVVTLTGVQPGATLRFGTLYTDLPKIAHMTVSWPGAMNGTFFDVETRCGGFGAYYETGSHVLDIDNRCAGGTFDATIASYRNGHVQTYQTLTNITPVDGGSIAFPNAYLPALTIMGSYTLPIGARLDGYLKETYDQRRYFDGSTYMNSASTDGTGALYYILPPAPGSTLEQQLTVHQPAGDETVGRRAPFTDPVGFDVTAVLAPAVTAVSFDAPARTLHWTTEAGAAPDVVLGNIHHHHSGGLFLNWYVVTAGDVTSITPPQFPASLAQYDVVAGEEIAGTVELVHLGRSYSDILGDLGIWLARTNIDYTALDWQGAPADLTGYTTSYAQF